MAQNAIESLQSIMEGGIDAFSYSQSHIKLVYGYI